MRPFAIFDSGHCTFIGGACLTAVPQHLGQLRVSMFDEYGLDGYESTAGCGGNAEVIGPTSKSPQRVSLRLGVELLQHPWNKKTPVVAGAEAQLRVGRSLGTAPLGRYHD